MPQQIARTKLYYDSLSRVIEDSQEFGGNTRSATSEQFTSHPVTQMAFPNGRQISNTYDALYRRMLVEETSGGADIAAWEFFGPARVAEVTLGNGLIRAHLNNARTHSAVQQSVSNPAWGDDSSDRLGYDGAGRMIAKRYLSGGIDGTTGAYDDPTGGAGNAGGGSVTTPISLPNTGEKGQALSCLIHGRLEFRGLTPPARRALASGGAIPKCPVRFCENRKLLGGKGLGRIRR